MLGAIYDWPHESIRVQKPLSVTLLYGQGMGPWDQDGPWHSYEFHIIEQWNQNVCGHMHSSVL